MSKAVFKILKHKRAALEFVMALALLFCLFPQSPPIKNFSPDADRPQFIENLQNESDALLPLFDSMPPVTVYVAELPVMKSGTSIEKGVAYTNCDKNEPLIYIKKDFYEKTNRQQLVNILKHELTHAWLCRQNLSSGHGELFRRKFTEVGGFGN
jgi:hypothetical protein